MKIVLPEFEILWSTADMLETIENAGRVCYRSDTGGYDAKKTNKFLKMLIDRGHESVLEHGVISVKIRADRGVTHELVRHRLASYSQESTRYCNYGGEDIAFVKPMTGLNENQFYEWKEAMRNAEVSYQNMISFDASPQQARAVLPNSLATTIVMTANVREWRHFLRLRTSSAAHPDMRYSAVGIGLEFYRRWPVLFDGCIQSAA